MPDKLSSQQLLPQPLLKEKEWKINFKSSYKKLVYGKKYEGWRQTNFEFHITTDNTHAACSKDIKSETFRETEKWFEKE